MAAAPVHARTHGVAVEPQRQIKAKKKKKREKQKQNQQEFEWPHPGFGSAPNLTKAGTINSPILPSQL